MKRFLVPVLFTACVVAGTSLSRHTGAAAQTVDDDGCVTRVGDYAWSCSEPLEGYQCISVDESSDPDAWSDNYFCARDGTGFVWSTAGELAGLACVQIDEAAEPAEHTWNDNYLCMQDQRHRFYWSSAGPLDGKQCLRWVEPADPNTWDDNYLCFDDALFDGDNPGNPVPEVEVGPGEGCS